jgi:CRISPR-associated endonuclease/helicase Cas3
MSGDRAKARNGFMPVDELEKRLAERLALMAQEVAARGEAESQVNRKRAEVLRACLSKAECPPGVFSLTVPTGGGKTLSSLAFALRHAVRHGKRRVIYAIPYTSIIEQTAGIFRGIFSDENVIEHHSNVEVDEKQETARSRLACENWDAPLIVTTNVQLLESLFASRTSRCRKLHNLVGSIIVLDEAQLLPVPYLQPVVDVLRLLVKDYGVTLVLCTATQPTLESRNGFDQARQLRGFAAGEIREIVNDVAGLYSALERVKVHLPADLKTPSNWEQLAPQVAGHDAVLAIVGRRADARELYTRVKAQDRSGSVAFVRPDVRPAPQRHHCRHQAGFAGKAAGTGAGQSPAPIRVISTQLVEAGVDIDFPVVYRALAGLDSIAQAAGRCNREGRLDKGEVHVFVPPKPAAAGLLRMAEQATRILWEALPPEADPMGVERFAEFFRRLYGDADLDAKDVCNLLRVGQTGRCQFPHRRRAFPPHRRSRRRHGLRPLQAQRGRPRH